MPFAQGCTSMNSQGDLAWPLPPGGDSSLWSLVLGALTTQLNQIFYRSFLINIDLGIILIPFVT